MTELRWQPVAYRRRSLLALLVLGQTFLGVWLLSHSLSLAHAGWPAILLVSLFAILFTWIGLGFWTAVFGFVMLRRGGDPLSLSRQLSDEPGTQPFDGRLALVMPVCHEPVQRSLGNLQAVYKDLEDKGWRNKVDVFVLSDSQDPEVWLEEQAACAELSAGMAAGNRLFYRRRRVNLNFKSGNIADFLRRWGARYRYMVVLDADSLLTASAIERLVQLMEQRPQAGIIQTAPRLARADTRFARLQQFANRCYGRIHSAGLAAIQLGDANYWGHNAIIRVSPFMAYCGLRRLRGWGLFRGPVLSHDYLESALMGRAGFEVWLEPAIAGSYEETPPTLKDDLIRDRRWCRGNLQHLAPLLTMTKLRLSHRLALLTGILSYLASPLWLAFLGLSGYIAMAEPPGSQPLPGLIGVSSAGSNLAGACLIGLTVTTLLGPRFLALMDQRLAGRQRLFGGQWRIAASTVIETLVSLLLAPIRMIAHSGHVGGAILNRSLRWQGQNRTGAGTLAGAHWRFAWAALVCASILALIQWHSPNLTPWALPVAIPVLIAPALMVWLSAAAKGHRLIVPEQVSAVPVITRASAVNQLATRLPSLSWFEQTVLSPHYRCWRNRQPGPAEGCKQRVLRALVDRCAV
ncbi:membrane glycosyltransferase [Marinobacter sp. MBR-99]|uniref:glucans biosynthesis glucosyltransferase MdoH n=1 Tax=Marinobacter sp. MBR-99 TaxID=3156461 RepID=UPI0033951AB7